MSDSLSIQGNRAAYTPGTVDLEETMALAQATLKDASKLLTVSFLELQPVEVPGATQLEPPKKLAMDANLLLAQLQDALNQLTQKVSVNDIKQNLRTQNEANIKQLQTMQDAAKAASAAAATTKEAEHKRNVFNAVTAWIGAAVTVASMVLTAVAAVAMLAVNPVAAAALFVAVGAMGVQLVCQVALAIDATMKAAGNEKGLGIDVAKWTKVMQVAGYVALAASMVGMVGGLVAAASTFGKEVAMQLFTKLFLPLVTVGIVGNLGVEGIKFGGKMVETNLREEASDLQKEADLKAADAEAIKAMIIKLQAMIQQLQEDLEEQMEKGENLMQSIMAPIKDRMDTIQTLVQNIGA